MFAARADILPEPYLSAIGTLTDQVPPLPPGVAERVVREELGRDVGAALRAVRARSRSPRPRWARCTGPRYAGREVVVKVLRPGVEELVARGPRHLLPASSSCSTCCSPTTTPARITAIVSEFAKRIRDELDFREEARNAGDAAAQLRRGAAGGGAGGGDRAGHAGGVLVLEYVEGTRIDRLHERLASGELDLARAGRAPWSRPTSR